MLWQRAACLARYRANGAAGTPKPVTADRLHSFFGGFAAIYVQPGPLFLADEEGRRKDKKQKAPGLYSRGLTGLGGRYNGRPASKEADGWCRSGVLVFGCGRGAGDSKAEKNITGRGR